MSRGQSRLYLSAPTPRPPMALPPVICVKECAHVCKAEPMQKTTSSSQSVKAPSTYHKGPHTPHADAIDDRLETLSASTPAPSAPNRHPSSSTAANVRPFPFPRKKNKNKNKTRCYSKPNKRNESGALISPRSQGPTGHRATKSCMTSTFAMTPWSYPNVRPPSDAKAAQRSAYVLARKPASPGGPYAYAYE